MNLAMMSAVRMAGHLTAICLISIVKHAHISIPVLLVILEYCSGDAILDRTAKVLLTMLIMLGGVALMFAL